MEDNKEQVEKEITFSPHLAFTHNELTGGAAKKRNVSLFMKSNISLTDKQKELIKSLVGDVEFVDGGEEEIFLEAPSLEEKLKNALQADIVNLNEDCCVFFKDDGLQAVEYSISKQGEVVLDTAYSVGEVISFEGESGNIILSKHTDGISKNIFSLLEKSLGKISDNKEIVNVYKSKTKGNEMDQNTTEIVEKATAPLLEEINKTKEDLKEALESLEKAQTENKQLVEQIAEIEKAQQDAKQQARLDKLSEVIADKEQAQEVCKSLESLEDEAFETVFKSYKVKQDALENSDLFKQSSESVKLEGEQETSLMAKMKEKYAKQ